MVSEHRHQCGCQHRPGSSSARAVHWLSSLAGHASWQSPPGYSLLCRSTIPEMEALSCPGHGLHTVSQVPILANYGTDMALPPLTSHSESFHFCGVYIKDCSCTCIRVPSFCLHAANDVGIGSCFCKRQAATQRMLILTASALSRQMLTVA